MSVASFYFDSVIVHPLHARRESTSKQSPIPNANAKFHCACTAFDSWPPWDLEANVMILIYAPLITSLSEQIDLLDCCNHLNLL